MIQRFCLTMMLTLFTCLVISSSFAQCEPEEIQKLVASDGTRDDYFGYSVSIEGDLAIISAFEDDDLGDRVGSAYIFKWDAGTSQWIQMQKLLPSDGDVTDRFGTSVSISGDTAIVGSPNGDGVVADTGAVYIYHLNSESGQWVEEQKIFAFDGERNEIFGQSVSIKGNVLIAGAASPVGGEQYAGAAYIFRWDSDTSQWVYQQKLVAADADYYDWFGSSVSIDNDVAIIGALRDDDNGYDAGAAYIYRLDTETDQWILEDKLLATNDTDDDLFGRSVAIHGNVAVIGATGDNDNGSDSGSAYIFRKTDTSDWVEEQKLLASDGDPNDRFGISVSIYGDVAIIGSHGDDDNGSLSGSAYIYRLSPVSQVWVEEPKLHASDGDSDDWFGYSVSLNENHALIGARMKENKGTNTGAAYVFDLNCRSETDTVLTGFSIETGTLIHGILPYLETSDDIYIHTRSGFGTTLVDLHNMEMIVNASTIVKSPSTIEVMIESRVDEPVGMVQLRLYNWNTNQFQFAGTYPIGNTDQIDTINNINATNFIDAEGNIDLSIKHLVFVPFLAFAFESFIDEVKIVVN